MATLDEFIQNLNEFPKIREFGVKSNYKPNTDHKNVIYFSTDENQIYLNGKSYGKDFSQAIEDLQNNIYTKEESDAKYLNATVINSYSDITKLYENQINNISNSSIVILNTENFKTLFKTNGINVIPKQLILTGNTIGSYQTVHFDSSLNQYYFIFTNAEIEAGNHLTGKLIINLISEIPTSISQLINDSNFITDSALDSYYTKAETLEEIQKVGTKVENIIKDAPEAFDTLKEIADKLNDNDDVVASIINTLSEKASKDLATTEVAGLESPEDKAKLEGLQQNTHAINAVTNDWITVAEIYSDAFCGTFTIDHGWNKGQPHPIILGIDGLCHITVGEKRLSTYLINSKDTKTFDMIRIIVDQDKQKRYLQIRFSGDTSGAIQTNKSGYGYKCIPAFIDNDIIGYTVHAEQYIDYRKSAYNLIFPGRTVLMDQGYIPADHDIMDTETFLKGLVKWSATQCDDNRDILQGIITPNSRGYVRLQVYGKSEVNDEGYIQHCTGHYYQLRGKHIIFGTYEHEWYYYEISPDISKVAIIPIEFSIDETAAYAEATCSDKSKRDLEDAIFNEKVIILEYTNSEGKKWYYMPERNYINGLGIRNNNLIGAPALYCEQVDGKIDKIHIQNGSYVHSLSFNTSKVNKKGSDITPYPIFNIKADTLWHEWRNNKLTFKFNGIELDISEYSSDSNYITIKTQNITYKGECYYVQIIMPLGVLTPDSEWSYQFIAHKPIIHACKTLLGFGYVKLGTLPTTTSVNNCDSMHITGNIGEYFAYNRETINIYIANREGVCISGFVKKRPTDNAKSWDIGVNANNEVYLILKGNYNSYNLVLFTNQGSINWTGKSEIPSNTDFTLLSESKYIAQFNAEGNNVKHVRKYNSITLNGDLSNISTDSIKSIDIDLNTINNLPLNFIEELPVDGNEQIITKSITPLTCVYIQNSNLHASSNGQFVEEGLVNYIYNIYMDNNFSRKIVLIILDEESINIFSGESLKYKKFGDYYIHLEQL